MTTATQRGKTERKSEKKLRIREELLPNSARYVTIDDEEYVCVPVKDFGDWYEDIEDRITLEDAKNDPSPGIPLEEVMKKMNSLRKGRKGGKS